MQDLAAGNKKSLLAVHRQDLPPTWLQHNTLFCRFLGPRACPQQAWAQAPHRLSILMNRSTVNYRTSPKPDLEGGNLFSFFPQKKKQGSSPSFVAVPSAEPRQSLSPREGQGALAKAPNCRVNLGQVTSTARRLARRGKENRQGSLRMQLKDVRAGPREAKAPSSGFYPAGKDPPALLSEAALVQGTVCSPDRRRVVHSLHTTRDKEQPCSLHPCPTQLPWGQQPSNPLLQVLVCSGGLQREARSTLRSTMPRHLCLLRNRLGVTAHWCVTANEDRLCGCSIQKFQQSFSLP